MSRSIKKLIRGPVWDWVTANTHMDELVDSIERENFWIVPSVLSGAEARAAEKELVDRFVGTKVVSQKAIDQYYFRLISESDDRYLLVSRIDGDVINFSAENLFDFEIEEATFLQKIDFIASCNILAPKGLPSRLVIDAVSKNEAIFEDDLKPYLPHVIALKISPSSPFYGDDFSVICVRAVINLTDVKSPVREFSGLIVQLALLIPREHHDWLFDQLYFAVTNRRLEHFFLGLYQMLEFFFPLKGIVALKNRIGYNGTFLELRAFCSEALGWNVNHHTGARAAAFLVTEAFANVCLGRTLQKSTPDVVEKHKLEAIGKISELRHTLAHQSFSASKPEEADLIIKTEALLTLLTEAFSTYKRHY